MIDAEFRSEERFARLSIAYETEEEKESVNSHVDRIVANYECKPEEIYTTKVSSGKEVLVIEYHDSCDREAGDVFEDIMKSLNITRCS
jgi:predicted Co/Zn/Cd cation transporter (cation efflux family)